MPKTKPNLNLLRNRNDFITTYLLIMAGMLLAYIIGYIIYTNFTLYWSLLNSEMAEDLSFVREAAKQKTLFPHEWLYSREIRLMHITSIMLFFYTITGNIHLSYPLASSFMLLANVGLFFYMMRYKKMKLLPITIGLIVLIMAFATFGTAEVYPIFNVWFINSSYSVHLASIFFILGVFLRIKSGNFKLNIRNRIILALTAFVAIAQGMQSDRLIINLFVPLFITEAIFVVKKYSMRVSEKNKESIETDSDSESDGNPPDIKEKIVSFFKSIDFSTYFVLTICTLAFLGSLIIKYAFSKGILITHFNTSTGLHILSNGNVLTRFGYYIDNLFHALGLIGDRKLLSPHGLIYFGRMGFIIVLALVMRKIWKKTAPGNTAVTVLILGFLFAGLTMTLLPLEIELTSRYLFSAIISLSVMSCLTIEYFIRNKQKLFTIVCCFLIFIMSVTSLNLLTLEKNESLIADRKAVAQFIRETGIKYGYGISWNGKVIEAVADHDFTMFFIFYGINTLQHRGTTLSELCHEEKEVFLVLSTGQADSAMNNPTESEMLSRGERHDLQGGWTVFTFKDGNPWQVYR